MKRYVIIATMVLTSCSYAPPRELNEYVYESNFVIHSDLQCPRIQNTEETNIKGIKIDTRVKRIEVNIISRNDLDRLCPICF